MAIQHKNIPDNQLHEPKGIATASEGTIYTSDGAGSGSWLAPTVVGQDLATANSLLTADGLGGTSWVTEPDHFANLYVERLVDGISTATSQQPSGLDTAMQVEFGPALNLATDPVQLLVDGTVKFNTAGTYLVKVRASYGRIGSSGVSQLYFRSLINGTQVGPSTHTAIDSVSVYTPYSDDVWITAPAGALLTFELIRDSSGNNSGGFFKADPVPVGWNDSPCAQVRVERFTSL